MSSPSRVTAKHTKNATNSPQIKSSAASDAVMTVHMKQFQAAHVEEPLNQSVNRESNDSFEGFLGDNERMLKEISANQEFVKRTESLI